MSGATRREHTRSQATCQGLLGENTPGAVNPARGNCNTLQEPGTLPGAPRREHTRSQAPCQGLLGENASGARYSARGYKERIQQ